MDTHISAGTATSTSTSRVATLCAAVLLLVLAITVAAALEMPPLDDLPTFLFSFPFPFPFSFSIPVVGATWALFTIGDHLRPHGLSEVPFEVVAALMVGIVAVAVMLLYRVLELSRRSPHVE